MSRNLKLHCMDVKELVAPREGRVSRNTGPARPSTKERVAPREGRVSRNMAHITNDSDMHVAPREGRVSRNKHGSKAYKERKWSRPARGV